LDAQRGLSIDQDALASTQGVVVLNLVSMYKALGGGWQPRSGQDFVNPETQQQMAERTDWGELLEEPRKEQSESSEESEWLWPDW